MQASILRLRELGYDVSTTTGSANGSYYSSFKVRKGSELVKDQVLKGPFNSYDEAHAATKAALNELFNSLHPD